MRFALAERRVCYVGYCDDQEESRIISRAFAHSNDELFFSQTLGCLRFYLEITAMPDGLSKRKIQGIKKALSYDYLKAKESKKKRRQEKALRQKSERHKSRQQEVEELLIDAKESETENGDEQ